MIGAPIVPPWMRTVALKLRPSVGRQVPAPAGPLAFLDSSAGAGASLWQRGWDGPVMVRGAASRDEALLEQLGVGAGETFGAVRVRPDGVLELFVAWELTRLPPRRRDGAARVGVQPPALRRARELSGARDDAQSLAWLRDALTIEHPTESARRLALISHLEPSQPLQGGAQLHGADVSVDLKVDDARLVIAAIRPSVRADVRTRETIHVLDAPLEFVADDEASRLEGLMDTATTASFERYLATWHRYERALISRQLRLVRDHGALRYSGATRRQITADGGVWELAMASDYGTPWSEELAAYPSTPKALARDADEDPLGVLAALAEGATSVRLGRHHGSVWHVTAREKDELPEAGVLLLNLAGDRIAAERRSKAAARLAERPQLQRVLAQEPPAAIGGSARRPPLRKLPRAVRDVFGKHEPTLLQRKALRLAWEVGGLIVIQGPPGTGKTTVINAIRELFAARPGSLAAGDGRDSLISAFQNEAVDTAITDARVLGLPARRVYSQSAKRRYGDEDAVAVWIGEQARYLGDRIAALEPGGATEDLRRARSLALRGLAIAQSAGDTAELLCRLAAVTDRAGEPMLGARLRADLEERAWALARRTEALDAEASRRAADLRRAAALLRTTDEGWGDDGPDAMDAALGVLDGFGGTSAEVAAVRAVLEGLPAAERRPAELDALRDALLDAASESALLASRVLRDEEGDALLTAALDELSTLERTTTSPRVSVLASVRDRLVASRAAVDRTLDDYERALGATTSMSGSSAVAGMGFDRSYRLVIIDEAARANPLDLLIPLVLGNDTQVIVGDHRQLPQLIDREAAEEVYASDSSLQDELSTSLFERMFKVLLAADRGVTLDEQFRMHPVLGNFISRTFYAPHGEEFHSRLPPADFAHDLAPWAPHPVAWLDVLGDHGHDTRPHGGSSYTRLSEAKAVVRELMRLRRARPDLKFGIIAMYKAQSELIRDELRTVTGDAGGADELVRVGTVDAFQGKEFDVVLLSLTRSNDREGWRARLGFTLDRPRMNVALSRAQRLVIAVGDSRTFLIDDDEAAPVRDFHALCAELGTVRRAER